MDYKKLYEIKSRLQDTLLHEFHHNHCENPIELIFSLELINSLSESQLLEMEHETTLEKMYEFENIESKYVLTPEYNDNENSSNKTDDSKELNFDELHEKLMQGFYQLVPREFLTSENWENATQQQKKAFSEFADKMRNEINKSKEYWITTLKILKREPLNYDEARKIIEEILDTLVEVGNGTTDETLHYQCDRLFAFRDLYLVNQQPQ